jgi:cytochrome b561
VFVALAYLVLAVVLTVTLNAENRWFRVAGTTLVALGLAMMVLSIVLANLDGTFAAIPATAPLIDRLKPLILNAQAAIASVAILFLSWSASHQARRNQTAPLPLRNTEVGFGRVSRYFHWVIAVLMFCLVPIGLFMAILPTDHPERASFVAAHQALGMTVLVLVALRLLWLLVNPQPPPRSDMAAWELRASHTVHRLLYLMLLLFPISGYLVTASTDTSIDLYGFGIPTIGRPGEGVSSISALLHSWILPILFYGAIAVHAGAVLKHHFANGGSDAVRRMLR